jgi:hypothetical protein
VAISREELLRLARAGARTRIQELQAELASIYKTFPELKASGGGGTMTRAVSARRASGTSGRGAAKRAWSAADRKAVSERMKKYWAARRSKPAKPAK